jgi:aromatic-L-amino-acid decarboxylase
MLKQWIEDDQRFELMAPVDFSLVCFRCNPKNVSDQQLDELNRRLLESVNQTGKTLLTHTTLKGMYVIRFCIAQRTTREEHVRRIWKLITAKTENLLEN